MSSEIHKMDIDTLKQSKEMLVLMELYKMRLDFTKLFIETLEKKRLEALFGTYIRLPILNNPRNPEKLMHFIKEVEMNSCYYSRFEKDRVKCAVWHMTQDTIDFLLTLHPKLLQANWYEFKAILCNTFLNPNFVAKKKRELMNLQQVTTVEQYEEKFLLIKAYLHQDDENVMFFKRLFVKGLKPEIRQFVIKELFDDEVSLIETATAAIRAESMLSFLREMSSDYEPGYSRDHYRPREQVDSSSRKLTPKQKKVLMANGGCFKCRKIGHKVRDCPMAN